MTFPSIPLLLQVVVLWPVPLVVGEAPPRPLVTTRDGPILGIPMTTLGGRNLWAFRSIPFAAPPVGPLRFQEPQPVERWTQTRDAGVLAPTCLQNQGPSGAITGTEDCLYLNVFTPQLPGADGARQLPVLVYIHGGAFGTLSGADYGPRYLLDHNLILVTLNYRLGILGFLSTEDSVVPGNMGLKDQVLGLRWVQDNIATFGGNPSEVTISGTSAGAASVHYHFISRMSRGLFLRGICMSGTSFMPSAFQKAPLYKSSTAGVALNCSTATSTVLLSCLREVPGERLVAAESNFLQFYTTPPEPFGPVVERGGSQPFLTQLPYEAVRTGEVHNGTMLFSIVTQEGIYPAGEFLANESAIRSLNENWFGDAPAFLDYGLTVDHDNLNATSQQIRQFYFGNSPITFALNQTVIQMTGDRSITNDVETTARLQAYVHQAPVYFYRFGYRGQRSLSELLSGTDINFGVSHGDDSLYLFNATYITTDESNPSDRAMIGVMSSLWANFTITGVPRAGRDVSWAPIDRQSAMTGPYNHLMISSPNSISLERALTFGNPTFWNNLPINEPESGRPAQDFL